MTSYDLERPRIASFTVKKYSAVRKWMEFAFVLFIFLSIFNSARFGASFSYVALPCMLIVFLALVKGVTIRAKTLMIFLFFLIYLLSTGLSKYVAIGTDMVTFFIFCFVYCAFASFGFNHSEIKKFIVFYILIAIICSLNIIYQWLTHHYYQSWVQRSSFYFFGVFKDPNYVMAFITPAAFFSFIKLFSNKKRLIQRLLLIISIAIFVVAGLAASSRGAIVSLILSCLFYFLFSTSIKNKQKFKFIILVSIASLIAISIAIKMLSQLAIERFTSDTDGAGRLELWKAALNCFYENPLIGGGINAGTFFSESLAGNATHNLFIDILCDSGIIGSVIFLSFCITNLFRAKKKNVCFQLSCVIAFLLPLFFINGFNTTSFYLPIFFLSILSNYNSKSDYKKLL